MSRIDELIEKICSNDVKYHYLGDICEIKTGKGLTKSDTKEDGKFPIISGGVLPLGYYEDYNRDAGNVTIARAGNAGYINYIETPFWCNDKCFSVIPLKNNYINKKYMYYFLKNKEEEIMSLKSTGTVPTVNTANVSKIRIAVPPMEVQNEIVHILDDFTLLSSELSLELKARRKQYEYYKNKLLKNYDEIDKISLKEIAEYSKQRINAVELNEDNYIGVDNLLPNKMGKTISSHIPKTGNSTKYCNGDILIGNIRPYLKKIWLADNDGGTNGDVLDIHITSNKIIPEYLYYILSSDCFFEYDNNNSKGAKMPRGNKDAVMNYKFYLPSTNEQEKIINILRKFEILTNDILEGIPAEIEARRKQYEYYRDKLLTFKELKVEN